MNEYNYDDESEGMRDALDKARAHPDLEGALAKLEETWGDKPEKVMEFSEGVDLSPGGADVPENRLRKAFETAGKAPEEEPSKATGDDKPASPPEEPWARMKYELEQNANRKPDVSPLEEKMKAAGWSPQASGQPPDWDALQKGIQDAEARAEMTRAAQQSFHAVAPRFQADANAGAEDIAAAKAPLEVAQQRQHFEAGQQAAQAAQLAAHEKLLADQKQQARGDPNSPDSQRARAALKPVFEMAGNVPEGFDKWTAADVEQHSKLLTPIAGQLTQEKIAKGREDAAAAEKKAAADVKRAADEGNAAKEAESLKAEVGLIAADPRALKLGWTPEKLAGLDRKGIEGVRHEMESMKPEKPHGTGAPAAPVKVITDIPDAGDRAAVQRILNGQEDAQKYGRKDGPRLAKLAAQIDPNYDSTRHATYAEVAKKMADDPQIQSAKTMKKHFANALEHIPEQFDTQGLNRIKNAIINGRGDSSMTEFETDVALGAGEMAKGIGENAEGGKELVRHLLDENQSPEQLRKRLNELVKLQDEALETKRARFESAAPKGTPLPDILAREIAPAGGGPQTPSGKPYARKQMNPATKQVRYLDKDGNVVEVSGG